MDFCQNLINSNYSKASEDIHTILKLFIELNKMQWNVRLMYKINEKGKRTMAFVWKKITDKKEKEYIKSKGFTYIDGEPMIDPRWCAIDEERDIILVSRGGGGLEMPEGYALYLDGEIIEMEGEEKCEGNRFDNNLKVHWIINKIVVNKMQYEKKYDINELMQIIKEAFIAFGYCGLKITQVLEVTVEINAELYDRGGEE